MNWVSPVNAMVPGGVRFSVGDDGKAHGAKVEHIGGKPERRALEELEAKGWIAVQRLGEMRRDKPTTYALAMYRDDETGEPPTMAFEHWTIGV
jgi:hypothetical protein